jgi:hypothetical protein
VLRKEECIGRHCGWWWLRKCGGVGRGRGGGRGVGSRGSGSHRLMHLTCECAGGGVWDRGEVGMRLKGFQGLSGGMREEL